MRLEFLRSLYESPGYLDSAYVSVYLTPWPPDGKGAAETAVRWRDARDKLARAGADEPTLDAVQEAMTDREQVPAGRAVFAYGGAVRLSHPLPRPPARELSVLSVLPHVMPLLAQAAPQAAHVRVAANRTGGEVLAFIGTEAARREQVHGETWPIRKVSAGGWSQDRYERSAEETWEANARRVAEAAAAAASQVRAEFIVVGGDVRERTLVLEVLPKVLRDKAVVVEREVAADSTAFDEAAEEEAARLTEDASRAKLGEFRMRLSHEATAEQVPAPGDQAGGDGERALPQGAVEGLAETFAALRDGLASDVLVAGASGDPLPDATAWIGREPTAVASREEELRDFGVPEPVPVRADSALIRAMAETGAELYFVPEGETPPRGGIGALLRAPLPAVQ